MGSGTTAEASVQTDRRYVGYEINPEYVKHARVRLKGRQLAGPQAAFFKSGDI